MMRIHRPAPTWLLTFCAVIGASLLFSAPALAAGEGLGITATFGMAGSGNGEFKDPDGVAVNQESGDVYVADRGNNRVERFSSTGEYEAQFDGPGFSGPGDIAIDNACHYHGKSGSECKSLYPSNGDVYVATAASRLGNNGAVIDKFNEAGVYIEQVDGGVGGYNRLALEAFAMDGSGNLWVEEWSPQLFGLVVEYSETGAIERDFTEDQGSGSPALAVDSADNVYLRRGFLNEQAKLGKFNLNWEQQAASETEAIVGVSALAVDLATNDLYVAQGASLAQYGPFGEPFSAPLFRSPAHGSTLSASAIAVNSTSHAVYVTDSSMNRVDVFGLGPVSTEPGAAEAKVEGETVRLEGELEGGESGFYFAYNDNGGCGGAGTTLEDTAAGTVKKSVKIARGLLEPGAQYKVCLVATNVYGEVFGSPSTFQAPAVSPFVEEVSSTGIAPFEATLKANVNPEKQDTKCVFEYAKSGEPYGPEVPCEPADLGSGYGRQSASLHLENLEGGTAYEYRVVVKNATGTSEGAGHFTTAPALVPAIEAESVSVESVAGAGRAVTFAAQVNPELQETSSCVFQYVTEKTFEATGFTGTPPSVACEPSQTFGKGVSGGVSVEAKLATLQAGVDYHYRFVVKNETGSAEGPDQVFGPPTAVTGGVLSAVPGVAPGTTATVGGELNPEGFDTHYYVQYGAEGEEYPQSTQGIDAGSGNAAVVLGGGGAPPEVSFGGLKAGAVYHYRLVAYNADGTTYGAPQTVTVLPAPEVGPASVSEVTQSSATITTSVNPEGLHTSYNLEMAYGTSYPGDAGSGSAPVPLTFHLSGLHAGDTYHFRLTAASSNGTSSGPELTFTTIAGPQGFVPVFAVTPSLPILPFTAPAFPTETGTTTTKTTPKALTRAQKLAKALKACKKKKGAKRASCETQAHKKYGPVKKKGATKKK